MHSCMLERSFGPAKSAVSEQAGGSCGVLNSYCALVHRVKKLEMQLPALE